MMNRSTHIGLEQDPALLKGPPKSNKKMERILGLTAVATVLMAWILGTYIGNDEVSRYLKKAMPTADRFEFMSDGIYTGYKDQMVSGYLCITQNDGYGGPMKVVTAVDLKGKVIGISVIDHKETVSFYKQVINSSLFESLIGKSATDTFILGKDVDGVSGATYSSRALVSAVAKGSHSIGKDKLNLQVPVDASPEIKFGLPEITVILLFVMGFVGRRKKFKYRRQVRWFSLLTGLVVLGILYNCPLTLAKLTGLLLGFIPAWQHYIYWILLIGGIFLFMSFDKKNPYCHWFCPFGAAQECLGVIGGAKISTPDRYRNFFRWTQRGLAYSAIILALLFRSPGLTGYEIYGALFSLTGSVFQMILLVAVLIASLFLKRPWCSYLCPVPPVLDLFRLFRG